MQQDASTPVPTIFQALHEKRLKRVTLVMRITAALMLLMALAGGWNLFSLYGKGYKRVWVADAAGGMHLETIRVFDMGALKIALPVAVVTAGFAIAYFLLSFSARRGGRIAPLAAGIMAMAHALLSAVFFILLVAYGVAMSEASDTWWERTLAIALVVLCIAAVPWFLYMTVAGFDGARRRGRRGPAMMPPPPV